MTALAPVTDLPKAQMPIWPMTQGDYHTYRAMFPAKCYYIIVFLPNIRSDSEGEAPANLEAVSRPSFESQCETVTPKDIFYHSWSMSTKNFYWKMLLIIFLVTDHPVLMFDRVLSTSWQHQGRPRQECCMFDWLKIIRENVALNSTMGMPGT